MDLEKLLGFVGKQISAGGTMGGLAGASTNLLVRENLSAYVTNLARRKTNVRDRLTRKQGNGVFASWFLVTGLTYGNSATAEGAKPVENDATYGRRNAEYKTLGKTKKITMRAIAAGANFTDQEAMQTEHAMTEVVQDEELMIFQGNVGTDPNEFNGLNTLVTTNVKDDNNNAFAFRVALINEGVELQNEKYSNDPNVVYTSFAGLTAVTNSIQNVIVAQASNGNARYDAGAQVAYIQSVNGRFEVVATTGIGKDSSTYPSNTVTDFYLATETMGAEDILYMEDLIPISKVYMGRNGLAEEFSVFEDTVLVCRAEEFQYKIENVRIA